MCVCVSQSGRPAKQLPPPQPLPHKTGGKKGQKSKRDPNQPTNPKHKYHQKSSRGKEQPLSPVGETAHHKQMDPLFVASQSPAPCGGTKEGENSAPCEGTKEDENSAPCEGTKEDESSSPCEGTKDGENSEPPGEQPNTIVDTTAIGEKDAVTVKERDGGGRGRGEGGREEGERDEDGGGEGERGDGEEGVRERELVVVPGEEEGEERASEMRGGKTDLDENTAKVASSESKSEDDGRREGHEVTGEGNEPATVSRHEEV